MNSPRVVAREEWMAASRALLAEEKAWTRERDRLAAKRRALPWERVAQDYVFNGVDGPVTLSQLFEQRSQLIVYHFMFGPEWQAGCPSCSFLADHVDGARVHFEQRDISFAAVSRAPIAQLESYRRRMGWQFTWVSAADNSFNFDYHVSFDANRTADEPRFYNFAAITEDAGEDGEAPGASVFYRDADGQMFHTYSTYARGGEMLLGAYAFIDMTPKGRDEQGGNLGLWVRRHDEYANAAGTSACCHD